jgi:tRNA G18 (ribose-2'-O)-methylase SpoU
MKKLSLDELNRLSPEEFKKSQKRPVVLILDNVRSLNNIGSIFRTCDAFRVEKLFLCGITATPPHREIQKTALGATESMEWEYSDNTLSLIENIHKEGYDVFSVEQAIDSIELQDFSYDGNSKLALVFGHEVHGVSQEVIDKSKGCIEIPQFGTKHSFNIAVSAGIVLWEVLGKIKDNTQRRPL